jgi:hypothetical protein
MQKFILFAILLEICDGLAVWVYEGLFFSMLLIVVKLVQPDLNSFLTRFLFKVSLVSSCLNIIGLIFALTNIDAYRNFEHRFLLNSDITAQMIILRVFYNLASLFVAIQFFEYAKIERERVNAYPPQNKVELPVRLQSQDDVRVVQ